jgi:hypothetical protein
MSHGEPPRGRVIDPGEAAPEPAIARAPAINFDFAPAPEGPALPHPRTPFEYIDRGWRPALGVICGVGFFYSFVAAPLTERREVDEAKLWVLATVALGLAGVKTAERLGPGMMRPAGLFTGPQLVTR